MPAELAQTLTQCCLNAMDKAIRDKVTQASATQQRFNTAAEVLSRLAIRLEPDQADSILNKAVECCQNAELAKSFVDTAIQNLLTRSWEALPDERRQHRAMDLLSTDVVGLSNIEPILEHSWPDPGELVGYTNTKLSRTCATEPKWQSTIDLIVRGLSGDATARLRASARMIPLVHADLLDKDESLKIASALWSDRYTSPDGLPANTGIYDWAFLTFPEPCEGLAEQRFRMKWLSPSEDEQYGIQRNTRGFQIRGDSPNGLNHDPKDVESRLWQVGEAIRSLQRHEQNLTLSHTDNEHLARLMESWAEDPIPEQAPFGLSSIMEASTKQLTRDVAEALPPIMGEITVSQPLVDKIYVKMRQLTADNLPAFGLAAGLVKINPERTPEVATALRVGVTSDDDQLATNAVLGLHQWLEAASDPESKIPQPPDDLVREVGIAIASRRNTVVEVALQSAAWIFDSGQDAQREAIQHLVEDGLRYLAQELRYDREHENPDVVPRRRLYCAKLAAVMSKRGLHESPTVASWLEMAREDPLPEVRQAVA